MLPDQIIGTYQRYKHDTTRFTTWLSRTAILCGFVTPQSVLEQHASLEPESSILKGPRLKGRARKLAREAAVAIDANERLLANKQRPNYEVTTRQLLDQARLVVSCKDPVVTVPDVMLRVGKRAVEARKVCVSWYACREQGDQASNKSHSKFVEILEEVVSILSSAVRSKAHLDEKNMLKTEVKSGDKPFSAKTTGEKEPSSDGSNNMFEALEVEECTSESEGSIPEIPLKASHEGLNTSTFELEQPDDDDCAFELFCFFRDMVEMRQHLHGVWKRYKQGEIDMVTASLVTITAAYCVKDMEEELTQRCSLFQERRHAPFDAMIHLWVSTDRWSNDGEIDDLLFENFYTFGETVSAMNHCHNNFCEDLEAQQAEGIHPPVFPTALAAPAKALLSPENGPCMTKHIHQGHSTVYKILIDYLWISARSEKLDDYPFPIKDILTEGFELMFCRDTTTIWTVFAMRVLLDAHDLIGTEIKECYSSLQRYAFDISTKLRVKETNKELVEQDDWPWERHSEKTLYRAHDTSYYFVPRNPFIREKGKPCGCYAKARAVELARKGIQEAEGKGEEGTGFAKWFVRDKDPAYYFKQNLLNNGTTRLLMALDYEELSLDLENSYAGIFAMAHLYNASRRLGWVRSSWPDLERAMGRHQQTIFGSNIPSTPGDMYCYYIRKIGVPARAWASNQREMVTQKYRQAPIQGNQLFDVLRKHYFGGRTSTQYLYDIKSLLKESVGKRSRVAKTDIDWTAPKLLGALEQRIAKDIAEVESLDHLALSRKCCELLRKIDLTLEAEFGNLYEDHYDPDASPILKWSEMVTRVLQGMAEVWEPGRLYPVQVSLRPGGGDLAQRSYHKEKLFTTITKVIEEFLKTNSEGT